MDDNSTNVIEQISYYKRFCFPELNSNRKDGGSLTTDSSTYIFTRTNSKGQIEYGYCRRINYDNDQIIEFPIVICIGNNQV